MRGGSKSAKNRRRCRWGATTRANKRALFCLDLIVFHVVLATPLYQCCSDSTLIPHPSLLCFGDGSTECFLRARQVAVPACTISIDPAHLSSTASLLSAVRIMRMKECFVDEDCYLPAWYRGAWLMISHHGRF
ncbi:hypothetical protein FA95DRAFT_1215503 [Auriscalpium vulgare]|uniref:Uncharacterized protein n=1 Tax=Auriscalpium vulgare TaxID=40419 RepID=A0ACB8RVA9_9AGAM|nr:hypothetical protein FA95DRAFT_1215503 [Auriscalpium vulgare]